MTARRITCMIAVLTFLLTATQSFSQEEMRFVDNSVFDRPVRAPSQFAHDAHNETAGLEDCNVCHHLYEDGQLMEDDSSEDQACSECHPVHNPDGVPSLRRAYHLNCKGCHLAQGEGPVMCAQCHRDTGAADAS